MAQNKMADIQNRQNHSFFSISDINMILVSFLPNLGMLNPNQPYTFENFEFLTQHPNRQNHSSISISDRNMILVSILPNLGILNPNQPYTFENFEFLTL